MFKDSAKRSKARNLLFPLSSSCGGWEGEWAVGFSGVGLRHAISWSEPPRWRLWVGVGRPGWVAVATIIVGSWVGYRATLGVDGGVLAKGRLWLRGREGGLGWVRAYRRSYGPKSRPGTGVAPCRGKRGTGSWVWWELWWGVGRTRACSHGSWVWGSCGVGGVREAGAAPCRWGGLHGVRIAGGLRIGIWLLLTCCSCPWWLIPWWWCGGGVLVNACRCCHGITLRFLSKHLLEFLYPHTSFMSKGTQRKEMVKEGVQWQQTFQILISQGLKHTDMPEYWTCWWKRTSKHK